MYRPSMRHLLALAAAWAMNTAAQDAPAPPPNPCETEAEYRQFDFWVGEWEVFAGDKKAGENIVSYQEGGCLVLEQWTDVQGGTGQSYNFYEPDSGRWRQVWISRSSVIDYAGGLQDDGSMLLEGEIVYRANGKTFPFTGRWTPLEDGTVRQHFEQYDPESEAWKPWFTGIYRRKGS